VDKSGEKTKVIKRFQRKVSPWVGLTAKQVRFPDGHVDVYHSLKLSDYVAILAQTGSGKIPIVSQFRPAVEEVCWELPAGLVDPGESPEVTCRRELLEETGLVAKRIWPLGQFFTDTGRLQNRIHCYFVETGDARSRFRPEPGMEVRYVSLEELDQQILDGTFRHQLHIAVLHLFRLHKART
jgi:ADP-ribose pyrophosphatase